MLKKSCPFVRCRVMPRRKCNRWMSPQVRVIRGPRSTAREMASCAPPCFCGPLASRSSPTKSSNASPQVFQPCRSPEVVVADAIREVKKLEAAIATSVHARGVRETLRIARNKTKLPSVSEWVESCKKFLERAKQRVSPHRKQFKRAEVAKGECRLAQLQVEASMR